jgi:hypothetical protein
MVGPCAKGHFIHAGSLVPGVLLLLLTNFLKNIGKMNIQPIFNKYSPWAHIELKFKIQHAWCCQKACEISSSFI